MTNLDTSAEQLEQLLDLAHKAKTCGVDDDDADEDDDDSNVLYLGDGRYHVCRGINCPYARPAVERSNSLVCGLSGRVISSNVEAPVDAAWTGRSCASADPDMTSGAVPSRNWRMKRDNFADSARAYAKARQLTDGDCGFDPMALRALKRRFAPVARPHDETKLKRGAACVTQEVDASQTSLDAKKTKAAKRLKNLDKAEIQQRLLAEATSVTTRLFQTGAYSKVERETIMTQRSDPRLENFNFVFKVGLAKYAKRCRDSGEALVISRIHDIAISSAKFVKQKRKEAQIKVDMERAKLLTCNSRFVGLLARLIVALWNALSSSDFYKEAHGNDSFRPFSAGVIYALKRGLVASNGTMILPALPVLEPQLPTLRSSAQDPVVRQLQASSHRGVCHLMRSLTSLDRMSSEDSAQIWGKLEISGNLAREVQAFADQGH